MFYPRTTPNLHFTGNFVNGENQEIRLQVDVENRGIATASELAVILDVNRVIESVQAAYGFGCKPLKGSTGVTRNRLPIEKPIHPGEKYPVCLIHIGTPKNTLIEYLYSMTLHISAYMRDQEPQHFEHKVTSEDYGWPDTTFEIEKAGHAVTSAFIVS
jgi:hypothetical protein